MKGISLIETLIVIAIITVLSLFGINKFINFRKDVLIENTTSEFISDIKTARSKSMNGELFKDENEDMFEANGLPEYGIHLRKNNYSIVRKYVRADGTSGYDELENNNLNPDHFFSENENYDYQFYFTRITGKSDQQNILIREKSGMVGRLINISPNFVISISKI